MEAEIDSQGNAKPVAIVAAASRRIGVGCARELAARGYQVVVVGAIAFILDFAKDKGNANGCG